MKQFLFIALLAIGINADTNVSVDTNDGESLYLTKCASCHGVDGASKALGKSKLINTQSKEELITALSSYKNNDGVYGGPLKGVMIAQSKSLSDSDIEILSDYIASFKK